MEGFTTSPYAEGWIHDESEGNTEAAALEPSPYCEWANAAREAQWLRTHPKEHAKWIRDRAAMLLSS